MRLFYLVIFSLVFAQVNTIGDVAREIQKSFPEIIQLLVASSYISGIGFGIAAIFKLKQVKDNATQIPISTPFALLATSALLVFLPGLFNPVGATLFGNNIQAGAPDGSTVIKNLTN